MLGAMAVVGQTANSVTIGWTRSEEERKAAGNQSRDPWFGISPSDRAYLQQFVEGLLIGA
jgi:hypothetical protein